MTNVGIPSECQVANLDLWRSQRTERARERHRRTRVRRSHFPPLTTLPSPHHTTTLGRRDILLYNMHVLATKRRAPLSHECTVRGQAQNGVGGSLVCGQRGLQYSTWRGITITSHVVGVTRRRRRAASLAAQPLGRSRLHGSAADAKSIELKQGVAALRLLCPG